MTLRVVSLVPSVTETLLAWGIEPIACTRFCEQPQLRHVGGTKDPDVAAIIALAPELVVVDAEENRLEDHDLLVAAGLEVHVLHITSFAGVGPQIGVLADRVGVDWEQPVVTPRAGVRRRAFVPIWRRPYMALGSPTYGTSVLGALAIENIHELDGSYPETTLEEAARRRPDLVIAPSEPYPFAERHRAELESVAPAVFVDGRDLFWWGVRTPGALVRLEAALSRGTE